MAFPHHLIVLLSGPVAGGKSELGRALSDGHGLVLVKTHEWIAARKKVAKERGALQAAGNALDRETEGRWVSEELASRLQNFPEGTNVVVDAVRIPEQVAAVRKGFGPRVVHVHVTAPTSVLEARYEQRRATITELPSYANVRADPTEAGIERLADVADILIDTERATQADVFVRVAARLGLYGRSYERLVDVMVGGQYGSEGKGNIAAYLAPEYDVLVRVGGPNAGHTVYEEPTPVKFYHVPSGAMRAPKAKVVMGPGAVIWPDKFFAEVARCQLEVGRLFIDPQAMVIEEADRTAETKTIKGTISSTAQGVGYATARKVLRNAMEPPVRLARDVKEFKPYLCPTQEILDEAFSRSRRVLLEGTQGTALSLHHGPYPYVTSRDTTASGCLADAGIAPARLRRTLMVCRTYPIRVANPEGDGKTSGPIGQELTWADISRRSGIPLADLVEAEVTTTTNRQRRVAEFDWSQLRRATSLNGPTDIALSFTDYLGIGNREAHRFEQLNGETIRFIEEIERVTAVRVSLIVTRFHYRNIIDRRTW